MRKIEMIFVLFGIREVKEIKDRIKLKNLVLFFTPLIFDLQN